MQQNCLERLRKAYLWPLWAIFRIYSEAEAVFGGAPSTEKISRTAAFNVLLGHYRSVEKAKDTFDRILAEELARSADGRLVRSRTLQRFNGAKTVLPRFKRVYGDKGRSAVNELADALSGRVVDLRHASRERRVYVARALIRAGCEAHVIPAATRPSGPKKWGGKRAKNKYRGRGNKPTRPRRKVIGLTNQLDEV